MRVAVVAVVVACVGCVVVVGASIAVVVVSSVAVVVVASSVVGGTFVDRLHSSVEVASHTVDGCCEVDVVWSSCDTFVEVNVVSEAPVVCARGCE